jgi:DMSO/TMAO reductase YedYZ molybdopterin-dependent catalytic subunit
MNLTLVGLNGTQTTLNEVDIENLPSYESWGGFKNSLGNVGAFGNYTGVPLLTLCNLVGGITANNSLRITAIDNYTAALSYGQVVNGAYITYDNSTRQQVPHNQSLTPILAYYYNGTLLSHDDGSPLRLVIVGPEGLLTDSILWVKWVAKLEVISRAYSDDMAVTNVVPLKTVVGQTFPCSINVTIENQGGYTEIFNGTLNANSTLVATSLNLVLANATFIIIRYNWNTKGIAYGNYTTWAYVQPVPGETNTDNNNSTGGWIEVTIPGDVNGDYRVTLADLVLLANAYGTQVGHDPQGTGLHQWNPNADIDNNGVVGLSDLVTLATHYGQHYP